MLNICYFHRLSIICLLVLGIACNAKKGNSAKQDPVMRDTIAFVGCQEKISINAGSIFEIKLEAISGTGYQWLVKESSPLIVQLEPDVLKFATQENKEGVPGHEGFQILQFKAVQKGEAVIKLEYRRTFEEGIEKSCDIKVQVE